MKKPLLNHLIISALFIFLSVNSYSQIVVGGGIGADYRTNGYYIEAAPMIGYEYKKFTSGVAPFLTYSEYTGTLAYGMRIFSQFNFYKNAFIHAEFQMANVQKTVAGEKTNKWVMGLPLGLGYKEEIANKTWINASILYDVLHSEDSPHKDPLLFRFGVTYSL